MTEEAADRLTIQAPFGSFVVYETGRTIEVAMTGEFDVSSVDASQRVIEHVGELVGQRPSPVVVDMKGLAFLDASGLRFLQRLKRIAQLAETTARVRNAKPHIERLLAIVELDSMVEE